MDTTLIILLAGCVVFGVFLLFVFKFIHKSSNKLNQEFYREKWAIIETNSLTQAGWISAVVEADKLLDHALKKLDYKGKTMGERMVSASRAFSDTDRTWSAHKLRNRVVHEASINLKQKHVDLALGSFRKALKDLGAL